jgi:hypothetical protein
MSKFKLEVLVVPGFDTKNKLYLFKITVKPKDIHNLLEKTGLNLTNPVIKRESDLFGVSPSEYANMIANDIVRAVEKILAIVDGVKDKNGGSDVEESVEGGCGGTEQFEGKGGTGQGQAQ